MSFQVFNPAIINKELEEMFSLLNSENYAVTDTPKTDIKKYARSHGIKASVREHPRNTTFIVKLKKGLSDE